MKNLEKIKALIEINKHPVKFAVGSALGSFMGINKMGTYLFKENNFMFFPESLVGQLYDNDWYCIHEKGGLDRDLTLFNEYDERIHEAYDTMPMVNPKTKMFTSYYNETTKLFQENDKTLVAKVDNGSVKFWADGSYALLPKWKKRVLYHASTETLHNGSKDYHVYGEYLVKSIVDCLPDPFSPSSTYYTLQKGMDMIVPLEKMALMVKVWGPKYGYKIDNYTWEIKNLSTNYLIEIVENAHDLNFFNNGFKTIKKNHVDKLIDVYDEKGKFFQKAEDFQAFTGGYFAVKQFGSWTFYRKDKRPLADNLKMIHEMQKEEFLFMTNTSFFIIDTNIDYNKYKENLLSLSEECTNFKVREYLLDYAKLLKNILQGNSTTEEFRKELESVMG